MQELRLTREYGAEAVHRRTFFAPQLNFLALADHVARFAEEHPRRDTYRRKAFAYRFWAANVRGRAQP